MSVVPTLLKVLFGHLHIEKTEQVEIKLPFYFFELMSLLFDVVYQLAANLCMGTTK
jgi:hypothetical protein